MKKLNTLQSQLTWRLAEDQDCDLYFDWVNDPKVRGNAIQDDMVRSYEHDTWFEKKLDDPDAHLLLFFHQNVPVGQFRVDMTGELSGMIDYSVTMEFRGRGVGTAILKMGSKIFQEALPKVQLEGWVKDGNLPSFRAFESAGYNLSGKENIRESDYFVFKSDE